MNLGQACRPCRGSCSLIPGGGCVGDLHGDEIVVSPPSTIVELLLGARTPPVQQLLHGSYKRGLHAFQGGQRHHGRFGAPEEIKGSGGAGGSNCRRVSPGDGALGHTLR